MYGRASFFAYVLALSPADAHITRSVVVSDHFVAIADRPLHTLCLCVVCVCACVCGCEDDKAHNCLDLTGNVLNGGAGVHPYPRQGAMLLADAHAEGILVTLNKQLQQRQDRPQPQQ